MERRKIAYSFSTSGNTIVSNQARSPRMFIHETCTKTPLATMETLKSLCHTGSSYAKTLRHLTLLQSHELMAKECKDRRVKRQSLIKGGRISLRLTGHGHLVQVGGLDEIVSVDLTVAISSSKLLPLSDTASHSTHLTIPIELQPACCSFNRSCLLETSALKSDPRRVNQSTQARATRKVG